MADGTKILIIEDNPAECAILRAALEKWGFTVFASSFGKEGVSRAKETAPDIVIIDTILPDADGFNVCRQIRQISGKTQPKIIIITDNVDAVDAVKARRNGCDDYVVKTADCQAILKAIEKLI